MSTVPSISGPRPALDSPPVHLPNSAMQWIIGRALVEPPFRDRLLNGGRAEAISEGNLGLSPDDRAFLLTIRANSLSEFAQAIVERSPDDCCVHTHPIGTLSRTGFRK